MGGLFNTFCATSIDTFKRKTAWSTFWKSDLNFYLFSTRRRDKRGPYTYFVMHISLINVLNAWKKNLFLASFQRTLDSFWNYTYPWIELAGAKINRVHFFTPSCFFFGWFDSTHYKELIWAKGWIPSFCIFIFFVSCFNI